METPNASMDPVQVEADLKAVMDHVMGAGPLDPEAAHCVRQRAEKIRQEVLDRCGVLNGAVDLIREGRDEE